MSLYPWENFYHFMMCLKDYMYAWLIASLRINSGPCTKPNLLIVIGSGYVLIGL